MAVTEEPRARTPRLDEPRARTPRLARARPAVSVMPPTSDRPPARTTTSSPAAAARLRGWAPVVIGAVAMAAMGVWGLDRGSMYSTEEVSVWAARLPFAGLWHLLSHVDAAHGLYYVMMHAVLAAGANEVLLRVPSVLGAVAAAALTARVTWRLSHSATVATLAGLIFAATPILNNYAQVGRSYAIDVALVMAASLALLRATDAPRRTGAHPAAAWRRWAVYGGLVVLAGYMHEMTSLMVLAHGVTLLWARSDRATLRRWAVTAAAAAVLMIPLVLITHAQSSALAWITFGGWKDVRGLIGALLGPSAWSIGIMVGLMAVAVLAELRPRASHPAGRSHPAGASRPAGGPHPIGVVRFALPLFVLPGATLLIESALATPLYGGTRYVLYSAAAASMLAAVGACRLAMAGRRLPRRAVIATVSAAVVLALAVAGWPQQELLRTPEGHPQDNGAASAFLAGHAQAGDGILYLPAASGLAELAYAPDFANVANIATAVSPEASGTFYGIPKRFARVRSAVLGRMRVWEFSDDGNTGMSPRQNAERRLLHRRFTLTLDRTFTGVRVMLWVRR